MGTIPFFGRERDRRAVDGLLAESAQRFSALVITGEPGSGKTTLLADAMARARARGRRVLQGRPAPDEAGLPYVVLADLVAGVDAREIAALPTAQREALETLGCHEADGASPALLHALRTVLRRLAGERGVLVVIDDLEWVDEPSARVLGMCLRRLDDVAVGFLAAGGAGAAMPRALDSLADERAGSRRTLGPLEQGALATFVRECCGVTLSGAAAEHLWLLSAGNPRAAAAVAAEVALTGRLPRADRLPVPASLAAPAVARLDALPAVTRQMLQVVAALRCPTADVAAAAVGGDPLDLAPAVAAGILEVREDRVRIADPLLASVVYRSGNPDAVRGMHARLVRVVEDLDERLWQLALGSGAPDERIAAELEHAAARLRRRGMPGAAAELATNAARLTPSTCRPAGVRRQRAAASYHLAAGDDRLAVRLLEDAAGCAQPGDVRAATIAELACAEGYSASLPRAGVLMDVALSEATTPVLRSVIHRHRAWVTLLLGDGDAAREHARLAVVCGEAAGDPVAVAAGIAVATFVDVFSGVAPDEEALDRAVALEDEAGAEWAGPSVLCRPRIARALLQIRTGHPTRARGVLSAVERDLSLRGDASSLLAVHTMIAELECVAGDWARADRYLAGVLDGQRGTFLRPWALAVRALARAHRGDTVAAREDAEAGVAAARAAGAGALEVQNLAVLALTSLCDGDPEAAGHTLAGLSLDEANDPCLVPWVVTGVEALVQLGRLDEAESLLDVLEAGALRGERHGAALAAARCRGFLLVARGDRAGAVTALTNALDAHGPVALPLERARGRLALGQLLRQDNQRLAAHGVLEDAHVELDRLGAGHWAGQAQRELDAMRQGAGATFTAAEQRIVELVVKGRTTAEVAAQLYVSVRTVEAHLSAIYRKADVRGRVELVSRLASSSA